VDPDSRTAASRLAVHELRHDLARARTLIEQVLADLPADAAAARPAESLQTLLDRTKHSLEGVLLGDADVATRQPVQIAKLVERVVDAHDPDGQRISWQGAALMVNVDPVKLERIVDNLLENALEHAPADTTVRLTSQAARRGVALTVEHDGTPIPTRVRERLEAYLPDDSRAPTGLEVVARFTRAHGGTLHLDPDHARVQVWIPLSNTSEETAELTG
jgi:signal transduction histidine kinase